MSNDSFPSVEHTLGACLALMGLTLTFAVDGSVLEPQPASVNSNKVQPTVSLSDGPATLARNRPF